MTQQVLTESELAVRRPKGLDEEYCVDCGGLIKSRAEICPHCGIRKKGRMSKVALVLLTFFFGGFGAHKFYLGKNWQGVLYLLFCWTGIPGLIAFVEFFIYAFTDERTLQARYPTASGLAAAVAVVIFFGGLMLLLILAALAGA